MAVILIGYGWGSKSGSLGKERQPEMGRMAKGWWTCYSGTVCMVAAIAFSIADVRRWGGSGVFLGICVSCVWYG